MNKFLIKNQDHKVELKCVDIAFYSYIKLIFIFWRLSYQDKAIQIIKLAII